MSPCNRCRECFERAKWSIRIIIFNDDREIIFFFNSREKQESLMNRQIRIESVWLSRNILYSIVRNKYVVMIENLRVDSFSY